MDFEAIHPVLITVLFICENALEQGYLLMAAPYEQPVVNVHNYSC